MLTIATVGVFPVTWARLMLMIHLLTSVFALGAVTHHGWALLRRKASPSLGAYAKWMAIGYALAWVFTFFVYFSFVTGGVVTAIKSYQGYALDLTAIALRG